MHYNNVSQYVMYYNICITIHVTPPYLLAHANEYENGCRKIKNSFHLADLIPVRTAKQNIVVIAAKQLVVNILTRSNNIIFTNGVLSHTVMMAADPDTT